VTMRIVAALLLSLAKLFAETAPDGVFRQARSVRTLFF
jgi:hypothetical protein